MKSLITSFLLLSSLLSYSQDSSKTGHERFVTPADIVWQIGPPTLPPGAKYYVIEGNLLKEGPIIMRLLLPAGYVIPPHFHPGAERAIVLSGTLNMGVGEKLDKTKCNKLPAASIAIMPAGGIPHYSWASEETIVQVHIDGPLQITYVNPDDDPRIKKK